jgi:cation diffusion facilitator family transporter
MVEGHPHHDIGASSHGESRVRAVVVITFVMMAAEIASGTAFRSMALLADGWHMGTHAGALGIALFAYAYSRRHARDERYSFGTGKVGALAGFASAVGLGVVAAWVCIDSALRLATPVAIRFDEAILVAVIGLAVNLTCALLLRDRREHAHSAHSGTHHHDLNRRAAYLHVLADSLTSVTAIIALLAGKLLGLWWMDPAMGIAGSAVIASWAVGLLRETGRVLLDEQAAGGLKEEIREAIEEDPGTRVTDLHLWWTGPGQLATIVSLTARNPREPGYYRERLSGIKDLAHVTVEVNRAAEGRDSSRG